MLILDYNRIMSMNYLVPNVIVRTRDGERGYDIYSRLLEDRIIFIDGEINESTASVVVAELIHLANEDPDADIKMYINSPGGSVYDGLAIYDTMNYIKPDVETFGIGLQASMGAFLLSSGTKGKRHLLPNSRVMIHQPSSGTQGKVTDQEISLREAVELKEKLSAIMAKNTGQKLAKIKMDMERDFWMGADEAVKYGVADSVVTK